MSGLMKRVVAEEMKSARQAKGLDQKELAKMTEVSQQRISEIESGEHAPRIDSLETIADGLDMTLRVFFEEEELEELDDGYHASRSFAIPVGLLKRLEAQARREGKSTNEYMVEALNRQVKEDSQSFYRAHFTSDESLETKDTQQDEETLEGDVATSKASDPDSFSTGRWKDIAS